MANDLKVSDQGTLKLVEAETNALQAMLDAHESRRTSR
jgi:hypothetical protein